MKWIVAIIATLALAWSLFVLLASPVFAGKVLLIERTDALSLMLAQVVVIPCLLWLAARKQGPT